MDTLSPKERSRRMSLIRGKNSNPEMKLRHLVHNMGFRYRLHVESLPGTPDLVFPSKRAVIFLHGCFWHRHENCKLARLPKSRLEFWKQKLDANKDRDARDQKRLMALGWRVLVVWECEMNDTVRVGMSVREFLCGSEGGE
ncbi:very short patch repair endonuclease [Geoalkalibacter sp.]|uniref:very short patch repair endonuclease n=1 Tax=Geoalkalibacter sp. TaxID=3041440 RepID=UPI00272E316D|nr:very short patch repair endonuclease [Geoalkalibacter sp.]